MINAIIASIFSILLFNCTIIDNNTQTEETIDLTNDITTTQIQPNKGYWFTANYSNITLNTPYSVPEITGITITPEPFSPDEDFIEDTTTITVELSEEGIVRTDIYTMKTAN